MFLKISQYSQENCIRASFNIVVLKAGTRFFNFSSKMHQKQSPRCSIKKLFLKISQNSQENTGVVVFFFRIDVLKNFSIFTRKHLCWSLFLVKLQIWKQIRGFSMFRLKYINRSSHRRCSIKKLFLKILQYSQDNTCVVFSFLTKL